jgi:FtsH-binding integral membrane protein
MDRTDYAGQRSVPITPERISDSLWIAYRWMSLGLATTGAVALGVAHSPPLLDFLVGNRLVFYALIFGQLGLVVAFSSMALRVSTAAAAAMFFVYAALTGVTFSTLFLVYTASSIASTFFVTAGAFAGLSFFGAVTHRDLSAIGRFGMFALIGIILAQFANMFFHSAGLESLLTFGGVILFAGLTAYDTQRLKYMFAQANAAARRADAVPRLHQHVSLSAADDRRSPVAVTAVQDDPLPPLAVKDEVPARAAEKSQARDDDEGQAL